MPTVLCRHYGHEAEAESLARDVHPDVGVRYLTSAPAVSSPDSSGLFRRLKGAVGRGPIGQLSVPDLSIGFWRRIRPAALRHIESIQPDVILTTSPLHATHDLGRWLRRETDVPWVADFRDPYRIDPRYQPRGLGVLRRSAHERFEASIYHNADLIVHSIPIEHRWARLVYHQARRRMLELSNGCPPELADETITPNRSADSRRSIRVIGAAGEDESRILADTITDLVHKGMDLELRLVGRPPHNAERIRRTLGDRAILTGQLPHRDALAQIAGADVLVCNTAADRARSLLLSSKLFEFLAVGVPVLVVNPTRSDRHLLRGRRGVRMLNEPGRHDLIEALKWALGDNAAPPRHAVEEFRRCFDRRRQVGTLAEHLDRLTGSSARMPAASAAPRV